MDCPQPIYIPRRDFHKQYNNSPHPLLQQERASTPLRFYFLFYFLICTNKKVVQIEKIGLSFGMEFAVDVTELAVGDMSVDLGGVDVGVAQEGLDTAEVGAVRE